MDETNNKFQNSRKQWMKLKDWNNEKTGQRAELKIMEEQWSLNDFDIY